MRPPKSQSNSLLAWGALILALASGVERLAQASDSACLSAFMERAQAAELAHFSESSNLLTYSPVAEAIARMESESSQGEGRIAELAQKERARLDRQKPFLEGLGKAANITGTRLYYPFGGADVPTPFFLSPKITDVLSQSLEPFGSIADIVHWSNVAQEYDKAGANKAYDSIQDYRMYRSENQVKGMGPMALSRIIYSMQGKVLGIHMFEVTADGRIQFRKPHDISPDEVLLNAVIVFHDPSTGQTRRFWYFQHCIGYTNGFEVFADQMVFDTLLIKAAPSDLFTDSDRNVETHRIALAPAKRNNARVISDSHLKQEGKVPQPIWKKKAKIQAYHVDEGYTFGYSSNQYGMLPNEFAFYGSASDLIDSPASPGSQQDTGIGRWFNFFRQR